MGGMLYLLIAVILAGITVPLCIGTKTGKKIKAVLIVISSLITIFAVIVLVRPIYVSQADASQEEAFAQRLAQGYFGYEQLDIFGGVSDYKIREATIFHDEENEYADITYGVKPYQDIHNFRLVSHRQHITKNGTEPCSVPSDTQAEIIITALRNI